MTNSPEPFLSLGWSGISWIEHFLVHGPGDVQGERIDLDDEFSAFVLKAYRVDKRGNRIVRRAFLSRAKGRSKSGLAAMLACFEALGPCRFDHFAEAGEVSSWGYEYEEGEPVGRQVRYAEVLNVATEEGQAGNTYDAIYYMLNPETCSPALLREFGRIDVGLAKTNLPKGRGFIQPVTSSDSSKDGGKSTFIVADETHLWILPRLVSLHGTMARNLLKRKIASGWMLETSTMYAEGDGSVAEGTHAYAKSLTNAQKKTLLFDHRQADESWDLNKRSDRMKALKQAYGPAAAWMNLDSICDSWDDPQVTEADFRRYWLNQPVPTTPSFVIVKSTEWYAVQDPSSQVLDPVALGVDVRWDEMAAAIASSGRRADGLGHSELIEPNPDVAREGIGWIPDRIIEIAKKNGPCVLVLDPSGPAGQFVPDLLARGFVKVANVDDKIPYDKWRLYLITQREYAQSCGALTTDIRNGEWRHLGQKPLTDAVEGARTSPLADAYRWSRKNSSVDISPLVAVTLARHGHVLFGAISSGAPRVWSIAEMVAQIKAEQAAAAAESGTTT